jgi:hypothetical protein
MRAVLVFFLSAVRASVDVSCPDAFADYLHRVVSRITFGKTLDNITTGRADKEKAVEGFFNPRQKNEANFWGNFYVACNMGDPQSITVPLDTIKYDSGLVASLEFDQLESLSKAKYVLIVDAILAAASHQVTSEERKREYLSLVSDAILGYLPAVFDEAEEKRKHTKATTVSDFFPGKKAMCPIESSDHFQPPSSPADEQYLVHLYRFLKYAAACDGKTGKSSYEETDNVEPPPLQSDSASAKEDNHEGEDEREDTSSHNTGGDTSTALSGEPVNIASAAAAVEGIANTEYAFLTNVRETAQKMSVIGISGVNMATHVHVLNTYLDLAQRIMDHLEKIVTAEGLVEAQIKELMGTITAVASDEPATN